MVRGVFRVPGAAGQPEAVHGDHGDGILRDLHQAAGLDGAGLIFGHGEDRAGDHGLQRGLRHGHAALAVDVRQLGIVLGIHGRDLEEGRACTDGDLLLVVDGDGDHLIRQLPDDIKEQASGHDARACLLDLGTDVDGDARFQIVARELQRDARPEKHALETGNGALLCDGAARNGQGRDQQRFFTGKLHNNTRFLYLRR